MSTITLAELRRQRQIHSATITAVDGCIYLLHVTVDGRRLRVVRGDGKSLTARSQLALRRALDGIECPRVELVHDSAYDEMIGQAVGAGNTLSVPLDPDPSV